MRKMVKRGLALLLCVCMSLSVGVILPTGVNAEIGPTADEDVSSVVVSDINPETLQAALPDGGIVLELVQQEGGYFDANGVAQIRVGTYRPKTTTGFLLKMHFDPAIVKWSTPTGATPADSVFGNVVKTTMEKISPVLTETESLKNISWTGMYSSDDGYTIYSEQLMNTTGEGSITNMGTMASTDYGAVGVELLTTTSTKKFGQYCKAGMIDADTGAISMGTTDEIIPLYSLYFKQQESAEITEKTFEVYRSRIDHGDVYQTNRAALYNFPKAEAPKRPLTVNVYDGTTSNFLTGARVGIYRTSADRDSEINEIAKLDSTNAEATAFPATATDFEEGVTYYYRVSKNGYKTVDDFFTVTTTEDPSEDVNLISNTSVGLPTSIKIVNGDTNELYTAGGTLSIGGVQYTIDTDGFVKQGEAGSLKTVELTENTNGYAISNVSAAGFESIPTAETASVAVKADANYSAGTATPDTIRLVPNRLEVQLPVPLNDEKNGFRPGAQVTVAISKSDAAAYDKRLAWSSSNLKTYMVSEDGTELVNVSDNLDKVSLTGTDYPKVKLPAETKLELSFSATGYSSSDQVKVTTGTEAADTAYTDGTDTLIPDITAFEPKLNKMSAPLYAVNIKQSDSNSNQITATVKLSNIEASFGTFGLMFDASVFELDLTDTDVSTQTPGADTAGFKLSDKLTPWTTSDYPAVTSSQDPNTSIGYHVFSWIVKDADVDGGAVFDTTTSEGEVVGTYTFNLREKKSLNDVSKTSFTIMEYDKTAAARNYLESENISYPEAAEEFYPRYFRYLDQLNTEAQRKADTPEGETFVPDYTVVGANQDAPTEEEIKEYESQMKVRLGSGKAEGYINNYGIDAPGFYQVFSNSESRMYDVMSVLTVELTPKKSSLTINVTDQDGRPLQNAAVNLYENTAFDPDGNLNENAQIKGTYQTDATGKVVVTLDGSNSQTLGYNVANTGYWSYPKESGGENFGDDIKSVNIAQAGAVMENVELQEKRYHKAGLWENDPDNQKITGKYAADKAVLGGGEVAFDGVDYVVKIKPAAGYKLKEIPEKLYYTLSAADTDLTDASTAAGSGIWASLTYNEAKKGYVLDQSVFSGKGTVSALADENGFRSDDINVRLDKDMIVEDETRYQAEARAGANGAVSYTKELGPDSTAFYPVKDDVNAANNTPYDEIHRTEGDDASPVQQITIGGIDPKSTQPHIGKFTFTADSGYCVEKVYINGVQIHSYDNLDSFEYTGFPNVTADRNIYVTFWDGETPSDELPATLMIGTGGKVSVSAPAEEADLTETSRRYVYKAPGKLTFTVTPDGENTVEVKQTVTKKDGSRTTSTLTGSGEGNKAFDIAVAKTDDMQDLIVTVTFLKDGVPLTLFVTSYVESGVGEIDPVGTYPYTYGDAPQYELRISDSKYIPGKVKVNGEDKKIAQAESKYSYTLSPQITEDTVVGAVFVEKSYKVVGAVDWSQGKAESLTAMGSLLTGGWATFTRQSDGMAVKVPVTAVRDNGEFDANLPLGVWDLTVTKRGYLNYTITGFEVTAGMSDTTFYGDPENKTPKKIVPLIGDTTGRGKVVDLEDAGVVANGLRKGIATAIFERADVDNDNQVLADTDMAFIKQNYSHRATVTSYSEFVK